MDCVDVEIAYLPNRLFNISGVIQVTSTFRLYFPPRIKLRHTLLHAQIDQIGVYFAGGFNIQLKFDLNSGLGQGLDDGLVEVVPLPPIDRGFDGDAVVGGRGWGWLRRGGRGHRRNGLGARGWGLG